MNFKSFELNLKILSREDFRVYHQYLRKFSSNSIGERSIVPRYGSCGLMGLMVYMPNNRHIYSKKEVAVYN